MTKHNNIEKQINRLLTNAKQNLQGYREKTQLAFELFVAHYETDLNKNSKVFYNIVKSLAQKDKVQFIDYVKQATNINSLQFTKDGCKLAFNGDSLTYDNTFIDSKKWYDKDKKEESKDFIYNDDNFLKAIKGLISKLKKEGCSVSNNLEKARALEKLIKE
jgi:hypothetical protein